jgi:hypothetical protein
MRAAWRRGSCGEGEGESVGSEPPHQLNDSLVLAAGQYHEVGMHGDSVPDLGGRKGEGRKDAVWVQGDDLGEYLREGVVLCNDLLSAVQGSVWSMAQRHLIRPQ